VLGRLAQGQVYSADREAGPFCPALRVQSGRRVIAKLETTISAHQSAAFPRTRGRSAIWVIASLGLFYLWHAAREAQLDAVQSELKQLARTAATLVNGDLHRTIRSRRAAG